MSVRDFVSFYFTYFCFALFFSLKRRTSADKVDSARPI